MSIIVRNNKELKDKLNKILIDAMNKVGETALKEMQKYVIERLGDDMTNEFYRQTDQFFQSIQRISARLNSKGTVETIIYYNTDVIKPYIVDVNPPVKSEQDWNWHADIYGNDISELLPYWIDVTGTHGDSFYDREPIGGLKYIREEWVTKYFRNELKKELKKMGIKTK